MMVDPANAEEMRTWTQHVLSGGAESFDTMHDNTQAAPQDVTAIAQAAAYGWDAAYAQTQDYPATDSWADPDSWGHRHRSKTFVMATAALIALLGLIASVWIVGVWLKPQKSTETVTAPPITITAAPQSPTHPPQTVPAPTTEAPESTTPPPLTFTQLQGQAILDRPIIANEATGKWMPQLSSKRPGVRDDGVVYDYDAIWNEHAQMRQQYNGKLLWSGDWPATFKNPNYWVTVAGIDFPDKMSAQHWCDINHLDSDHCLPVLIQ